MKRSNRFAKTIPLLLGAGIVLSACATAPDYGAAAYPYPYVASIHMTSAGTVSR
jgi:hypothetical protein